MKKKYKVTTLLIVAICFFAAMMFADVFFVAPKGKRSLTVNAEENQKLQEEVLFSLRSLEDNNSKTEQDVVYSTIDSMNKNIATDKQLRTSEEQEAFLYEEVLAIEEETSDKEIQIVDTDTKKLIEEDNAQSVNLLSLPQAEVKESIVFDKVIPKVNESLNVRLEADAKAEITGKLYKNSYATIVERGEEWTKITSGDVTGYVSNEYLYFDKEALEQAEELSAFKVKITAGTLNIRKTAGLDGEILGEAKKDDTFIHVPESDTEGWFAIQYNKKEVAYVTSEYASEFIDLDTAVSKAEEEKIQKEKELARALAEAKKHKPDVTNRAAIQASDEEIYLLATVVAMEALGESYEGKLAVANVVVNRMLNGSWGNTISDVVYAPGQFSGANSGRVQKYASKVTESCKRAAIEALAGNNNIGNYMYFIMKNKARTSSYSKYYILGSHCFYAR